MKRFGLTIAIQEKTFDQVDLFHPTLEIDLPEIFHIQHVRVLSHFSDSKEVPLHDNPPHYISLQMFYI